MTRLFLKFYLGVLAILIMAWLVQAWLYGSRLERENAQVARDALYGGVRVAREKYFLGQKLKRADPTLRSIQQQYDFPVKVVDVDPGYPFDLLLVRGSSFGFGEGTFIIARLSEDDHQSMLFGPLPSFTGPTGLEVAVGLGVVLLTAAMAIAFLIRPVYRQFRAVESAAEDIAAGELSRRIPHDRGLGSSNLVQAFNKMATRTESMVRSQRELLQAVSHDLRTPLARIHFGTDLLRTSTPDERESRIRALESAADDLDRLVEELLTYARAGHSPEPVTDEVCVVQVAEEVVEKQQVIHPRVRFVLGAALVDARPKLHIHAAELERLLTNLVSNAATYGRTTVEVNAVREADTMIIDIDDDGPGIAEENRERVFEPFVRLADSPQGVGLGLAIVRRIAMQYGATITATDSPQGGCRIRLRWPARSNSRQRPLDGSLPGAALHES